MNSTPKARVVSIVYRPKNTGRPQDHYERVPTDRVRLVELRGVEGDLQGSSTSRQLNVMVAETLAELGAEGVEVAQGDMGEQSVRADLDLAEIVERMLIKLGKAVIEV